MDTLSPVLGPVQRVWRGLSRGQQIGLVAVLAALGGLLFIVTTVGRGPDGAIAFSGLSNDDEAAIVQKLKDAVGALGQLGAKADASSLALAKGNPIDIHEVMLNTEQASLGFSMALQVRNKLVDAYQEVMRMSV